MKYKFMEKEIIMNGKVSRITLESPITMEIVRWHRAAELAEYIMDNEDVFNIKDEDVAYYVAQIIVINNLQEPTNEDDLIKEEIAKIYLKI